MTKRKLRELKIEGKAYLWTRKHVHLESYVYSPCVEVLTIYKGDYKKAPIRLFLREEDSLGQRSQNRNSVTHEACWFAHDGGDGVLWKASFGTGVLKVVNLNHPGVVVAIAKFALQNGWSPETMRSPMEIDYGFDWIDAIDFPEPRGDK